MTELDLAYYLNRVSGLIASIFAIGLCIGYARVLDSHSPLVRSIAWSILLLTIAAVIECLRVVDTRNAAMHYLACVYNLMVLLAAYRGLQAQHRMIPDEERSRWHWYSAPIYPPWAWVLGLERFVNRLIKRKRRESNLTTERRVVQQPITFPDRREGGE